ncbi:alpha/beta hydrolase [Leucobacter sp. wl10]|nr:alpha/beta hydrolase [Leucobacter sp. wl10]
MLLPGPAGQTGAPTVVFEAGSAATRSSWARVQTRTAAFARAAVYDRAGLGRSAPDPVGRSLDRMADDLNDLLDGLGSGRFLLVGHSAGGPIVRLAAARRPERVAGLVLVDPTDEATELLFSPLFRIGERVVIAAEMALARLGLLERLFRFMSEGAPADVRADLHREAFRPSVVATQARQARTFLRELRGWQRTPPILPDVPVTVISGGRAGGFLGMPQRIRDAMTAAGRYRAAQSPRGRHVVADRSGHDIPLTQPELIADEIRRLLRTDGP